MIHLEKLRKDSSKPDFWNDNEDATNILKQISLIEKEIALWTDLERRHDDMEILFEFADAGETDLNEIETELYAYKNIVDEVELKLTLSKPEDIQNAIVSIHPGAGGTESQDWAQMLYRMYTRWAEKEECKLDIIDFQTGDEAVRVASAYHIAQSGHPRSLNLLVEAALSDRKHGSVFYHAIENLNSPESKQALERIKKLAPADHRELQEDILHSALIAEEQESQAAFEAPEKQLEGLRADFLY